MPADFETGFVYDKPAWHGQAIVLDHPATAEEALDVSGLNWEVSKEDMRLDSRDVKIPNNFAIVRDIDSSILGVVGSRYHPLQNRDAFRFFDGIIQKGEAIYHTAGSLSGGKKIWILAKLPGEISVHGKDKIEKYVLITNSHDGNSSIIAGFTAIRVVCSNTLNYALQGLENSVYVRHTINAPDALSEAHRIMGMANESFSKVGSVFNQLSVSRINIDGFKDYLDKVFPTKAELKPGRTDNMKVEVSKLYNGQAIGADIDGFGGTLWGAYNSVVEYADYRKKSKDRLNSVWFGGGARLKERAFHEAVKMI